MSERKFGLGCDCGEVRHGGSLFSFSAYDMALLYNCKLLKSSINKLCNCSFDHIDVIRRVLRDFVVDPDILDAVIFNCDDDFFQTCFRGSYFAYKDSMGRMISDSIFLGFSPELLCRDVVYKKNPVENYLYSVAVKSNIVDMALLRNNDIDYCQDDSDWIYFPVDNFSIESDDFANGGSGLNRPCVAASFDLERNLDICHSLITLHKMQVLISVSGPKIVDRLNLEGLGVEFELGRNYNYVFSDSSKRIYCGDFIHMKGIAESFYFGISPNVFDEEYELQGIDGVRKTRNPHNVIVSDYFSSVAMVIMNNDSSFGGDRAFCNGCSSSGAFRCGNVNTEKYINNGVEFAGNWVYFPVCRKLLCCDNFEELYINRIVKLIREGFLKYFS